MDLGGAGRIGDVAVGSSAVRTQTAGHRPVLDVTFLDVSEPLGDVIPEAPGSAALRVAMPAHSATVMFT